MKRNTPAPAPPSGRPLLWTLGLLAVAVALVWGALTLQGRRTETARQADLQGVVDTMLAEFSTGLPKQFAPGLILDKVAFEGTVLVMTLRSNKVDARTAQADPAMLRGVQVAEMERMVELCRDRNMVYLLARGMNLTRRFVDAQGSVIFEITLTPQVCRSTQ